MREPLRPEDVEALAASPEFRALPAEDDRMVTGAPDDVVKRLRDLRSDAGADEVVVVTPAIDRDRRIASYRAIAEAWPAE